MMFENRQNIDLLDTSKTNCDQLLRELKNLDSLNCRETHKIGEQQKRIIRECFMLTRTFSGDLHRSRPRRKEKYFQ